MRSDVRHVRRSLLVLLAIALLAGGGLLYARLNAPAESSATGAPQAAVAGPLGVSALGRLEPEHGIRHIAGPSLPSAVVRELLVDRGDAVRKGQLLATLDTRELQAAIVREKEAELVNARREYERSARLSRSQVESDSRRDEWQTRAAVAEAQRDRAVAEQRLTEVRSPIDGRVLDIHAGAGERIGPEGVLDLGATQAMYAIAEVYETDIGRVAVGQRARITSPVFPTHIGGVVQKIRPKVDKQDALGTDPAARKDARVVEVEVRLDESEAAADLTYVQVEVTIFPDVDR